MSPPTGFDYTERKDGSVLITHHGRAATVLRGAKAAAFVADVAMGDAQLLMARLTGNYKHGNERRTRRTPRRS